MGSSVGKCFDNGQGRTGDRGSGDLRVVLLGGASTVTVPGRSTSHPVSLARSLTIVLAVVMLLLLARGSIDRAHATHTSWSNCAAAGWKGCFWGNSYYHGKRLRQVWQASSGSPWIRARSDADLTPFSINSVKNDYGNRFIKVADGPNGNNNKCIPANTNKKQFDNPRLYYKIGANGQNPHCVGV